MKDRDYFRDMDFSHRKSIEEQESNDRWVERHAPERNMRALIRKLYQGGLSKERIYLTLCFKMKQIWPNNSAENLKNIIDGECKGLKVQKKDEQPKKPEHEQDDFEDR